MPFIAAPITTRTRAGAQVAEVHEELLALSMPIAKAELTAKRFGTTTSTAIKAFQKWYGLPQTGTVDVSTGRLMHVTSLFVSSDDRAAVRAAIRNAIAAASSAQPREVYWLARYAVLNGDYTTASTAARVVAGLDLAETDIPSIIEERQPGRDAPEVPYPENFYSYRRPLVDPSWVERVYTDLVQEDDLENRTKAMAMDAIAAHRHWNAGNDEAVRRRYDSAVGEYNACQDAVLSYFDRALKGNRTGWDGFQVADDRNNRLTKLINYFYDPLSSQHLTLGYFERRRELLSLVELNAYDVRGLREAYVNGETFIEYYFSNARPVAFRLDSLNPPLLTLAYVLAPLARAEANRMRRQYRAAIIDLRWVLNFRVVLQQQAGGIPSKPLIWRTPLTCSFIELPFARLLLAETLLDKADAEYKARIPADPVPAVSDYQELRAAQTYLEVKDLFKDEGEYVTNVQDGCDQLETAIRARADANDTTSQDFQTLGMDITVPTVGSSTKNALPGLDPHTGPHESMVRFSPPTGEPVIMETNPRIYAILLTAFAKLEQLRAGFNWLGYSVDYVPPWRFPFLLERARYFAEHAKNAQREYLNFLSNAEREEFQELTTAQNVELEKTNIRIETARVDQARSELAAAQESADLADLVYVNSQKRFNEYAEFDRKMDSIESASMLGSFVYGSFEMVINPLSAPQTMNNIYQTGAANSKADAQRDLEKFNLALAKEEADQSRVLAQAQLATAYAGLLVAGLQRQASLLRHEYAIQNLAFLRNRALSAEQWYRLVAGIRSVSETYLRYAIELAFLAEQAYEFEADKALNVIRFDYDISELGEMLAADFLLRDLNTLEQDLIVGQRLRQQQVRYVLSLSREFPEALQNLRDDGIMTFSLRLEMLERRFSGLYNLRVSSVEVLPVALMDPTRFSLQLTHLGTGQVRLKAQPDTSSGFPSLSTLNTNDLDITADDWLRGLREQWPVKVRVTGRETAVFSGLTRQEQAGLSTFFTANQRGAFEGLAGASSWEIDMSMKENQVVPGTLADVLITFTLSGYYDPSLRKAIDGAPRKAVATTTWFSGHRAFPDAFFQFNRSGQMDWDILPSLLSFSGSPDSVRNVSVLLQPSMTRPALGRLLCSYPVEFDVDKDGQVTVISALPDVRLTTDGLTLRMQSNFPSGTTATWDFGDGTALMDTTALVHDYSKPGRYELTLRLASNGRLFEYRVAVVVSRANAVMTPLIVVPVLSGTVAGGKLRLQPSLSGSADESLSVTWRINSKPPDEESNPATFELDLPTSTEGAKRYVLQFTALRELKGRFYSKQRYVPDGTPIPLTRLHLTTNRTFEVGTDTERPSNPNAFTQHLFGEGPVPFVLSPTDRWTLELPMLVNPALITVSSTDVPQHDLSEISDALLVLEYKVREV